MWSISMRSSGIVQASFVRGWGEVGHAGKQPRPVPSEALVAANVLILPGARDTHKMSRISISALHNGFDGAPQLY